MHDETRRLRGSVEEVRVVTFYTCRARDERDERPGPSQPHLSIIIHSETSIHVWSSGRFRCVGVSPSVRPVSVGPERRSSVGGGGGGGGGSGGRRRRRRRRKAGGSAPADRSADLRGSALKEPDPQNVRPGWKNPPNTPQPCADPRAWWCHSRCFLVGVATGTACSERPTWLTHTTFDLWVSHSDIVLLWRATCENTVTYITLFINTNNIQMMFNVSRCERHPGLVESCHQHSVLS